jgi:hypothetical protein
VVVAEVVVKLVVTGMVPEVVEPVVIAVQYLEKVLVEDYPQNNLST